MARGELWSLLEEERRTLADRVESLPATAWDADSRCTGWRVRDVLGHLVHMAEGTLRSVSADVRARGGRDRDRGFDALAREHGDRPVPELCQRLRAAAGSRYSNMPSVALSEVVIHGDDMLRPLGQTADHRAEVLVPVLRQMHRVDRLASRFAFGGVPHRGVTLRATDVGWTAGRGPEVAGSALDLLALFANRPDAVGRLAGPGVSRLPEGRP